MMQFFRNANYNLKRTMANDPAARSRIEVLLLYPHIKAIGFHRIAHRLYRWHLFFLDRDRDPSRREDRQRTADRSWHGRGHRRDRGDR